MAKICIDPGHYKKYNRSPGVPEYFESEMAWKLSNFLKQALEKRGHVAILTRNDPDKDLALQTRGKKSKGCDLFLSMHSNAAGNSMNEKINYIAVYHLVDDKTVDCDDKSKDFAEKIAPVIGNVMNIPFKILTRKAVSDRNGDGQINDNYYGVLHGARSVNTPGLILEHGFHTNTECTKWLLVEENLKKLAEAEADCIDSYFSGSTSGSSKPGKKNDSKEEPSKPVSSVIKVQVTRTNLNIRKGPGTNFERVRYIEPGVFSITEIQNGLGSKTGWGKLKSGAGWISLDYVQRI